MAVALLLVLLGGAAAESADSRVCFDGTGSCGATGRADETIFGNDQDSFIQKRVRVEGSRRQNSTAVVSELTDLGVSGCNSSSPCGRCAGDCDNPSDCQTGLKCFHRSGFEAVPGCDAIAGWHTKRDFCVDPQDIGNSLTNFGKSGCTPSSPCPKCAGDCDEDSDCMTGLKCLRRDGNDVVPGCSPGGSGDKVNYDYCVDPQSIGNTMTNFGKSGCTSSSPCPKCAGDCDEDSDCMTGLKCFLRDGNDAVPGCEYGHGDKTNYDYCYAP